MDTAHLQTFPESPLGQKIEEQRAAALDQIEAAWQVYVSRIEEVLSSGWRENLQRALGERFLEIAASLEEAFATHLEARVADLRRTIRSELADWFNESLHRLRSSESETDVYAHLIELAGAFCDRAVLTLVEGETLRCAEARDFPGGAGAGISGAEAPLNSAAALMSAAAAKETTVAEISAGELSERLAAFFADCEGGKVSVVPVVVRDKAVALLCAARKGADPELGGLELLAMASGMALESRAREAAADLVQIAGPGRAAPDWGDLSKADAETHAAARRFARVQVAEMRLFKAQAVREGRLRQDLYSTLRGEIDTAREGFRTAFLSGCPTMADYLHLELVRTLANDDARLLGPEYPGPLV